MSVLLCLVWIEEEELCCSDCFRYITFFNIYYVNLDIVRNIPLLYQARQQPAISCLMAKI